MIRIEDVSLSYGKKEARTKALSGITLKIERGEFVTVVGKSGCGKTSLLNILGGIIRPDGGTYLFNNQNVASFNDTQLSAFRNSSVSFVVQHFALINDITVFDNIELPLKYRRNRKIDREELIIHTMEDLGILDKCMKYPYQLSGGEKQRTAICRAIVADTPVILADEPTGALDESTGKKILSILQTLNKKGKTIIMVTHDQELARAGTHRITMSDGAIINEEYL